MAAHTDTEIESAAPDAAESAGVPWRSRTVRIVLASTLLAPLGVPLVSPALPAIRDAFGLTDARASLLISAYFLVGIVLSPFVGMVADRVGRKRVLVTSLLVLGLSGVPLLLAPSFEAVLAVRVVQGTAAAGIFVTTVTILGDAFDGVRRNAVLGVNNAALSLGAMAFPVLGGALVAVAWNAPFAAYLLAVPVGLLALVYLEEPDLERETRGVAYLRDAASVLRSRRGVALARYRLREARERVVLPEDAGSRVAIAVLGDERRRHPGNAGFDLEAPVFECLDQRRGGLLLVETQLRRLPDPLRDGGQFGFVRVDSVEKFRFGHVLGSEHASMDLRLAAVRSGTVRDGSDRRRSGVGRVLLGGVISTAGGVCSLIIRFEGENPPRESVLSDMDVLSAVLQSFSEQVRENSELARLYH